MTDTNGRAEELSRRETEIARAYAAGASYKTIARDLGIAPATVRTHLGSIYRKLDVSSKIKLREALDHLTPLASAVSEEAVDVRAEPPSRRLPRVWVHAIPAIAILVVGSALVMRVDPGHSGSEIVEAPLALSASSAPSIAILPFGFDGTEPQQQAFVRWISRDTATDLAKFSTFFVFSTDTTFRLTKDGLSPREIGLRLGARYLLSGDVQWLGEQVRLSVEVIDSETARIVWSERFERPTADLPKLQVELAGTIAAQLGALEIAGGRLRQSEMDRIARAQTGSLEAYAHYLRGWVFYERFDPEGTRLAEEEFSRATQLDPAYAKAHAMLAWTHLQTALSGPAEAWDTELSAAEAKADDAMAADPLEPFSHWAMGAVRLFQKQHDLSIAAYERAVTLNPSNAEMLIYLGWALVYTGDTSRGLEFMNSAIKRNPAHPGWYYWDVAFAHFVARNYEEAARVLEQRSPRSLGTHHLLALIYARLGRSEEAEAARNAVLAGLPDTTVRQAARTEPFARASDLQHYLEAMRDAGFPD
jgi:adenylate cyclase